MSNPIFMNLCRLCLVKGNVSMPIFEGEGAVRNIFMKIITCLPIKIERQDQLPKKICDVCLYNVENVFKFWCTTANSEKKLLQWLEETDDLPMGNSSTIEMEQVMLKENTREQEYVSKQKKSQDNKGFQYDLEHKFIDEDYFNSEEDPVNDNVDNKKDSEKEESEEEDGDAKLEPTMFMNISMTCQEPRPSRLQSGHTLGQDVESVGPQVTPVLLQPVHSIEVQAAESVKAEPEVVPSTSKTSPASSVMSLVLPNGSDNGNVPYKEENILKKVKEEEDLQTDFEGVWNYQDVKEEGRDLESAKEENMEEDEEEDVKPPLLILLQPNGSDDNNDKCKERNVCEEDGGISKVKNLSIVQEKKFCPEIRWRMSFNEWTSMEQVKKYHETQKEQTTLGRPRGLVPAKCTAQRMQEYRQRLKDRRNRLFEQNIERSSRMDNASVKKNEKCSGNKTEQPTLGRARGLVPAKCTAMQEYRQQLKLNQSSLFL